MITSSRIMRLRPYLILALLCIGLIVFFGPMFVYDLGFGLQSQGFNYYRDGKYEDALKLFYKSRKYLQLSGFDQLGKAEIAACYYHLGDNNAALREGGIELPPSRADADVNNALGVILFASGRYAESKKRLESAVHMKPGNPVYHWNLSIVLTELENTDRALDEKHKAFLLSERKSLHWSGVYVIDVETRLR